MKIIIAGAGMVGETLAAQLSEEKYDLTLIDSDGDVLDSLVEQYDVMALKGNSACMEVLKQAEIEKADLLVAVTNSDEVNLLCCLTAHNLNPKLHTIARIRNPEYTEQIYSMRQSFALSEIFNPERQAAEEIERLLKYPAFLKRDSFLNGRMEIVEIKVDKNSKLCDVPLSSINAILKCRVLVCAVLRGGECIAPTGNFVPEEGDKLFVTAPSNILLTLIQNLGLSKKRARRITIVGGGTMSYYLAELLLKSKADVQIVESDKARCEELASLLAKATIINGDPCDQGLFEREGIENTDALVTLSAQDEVNIVVSLYGHSFGVPQIITKLERIEDQKILNALPMGSVVSPRKLCSSNILRYVRSLSNQVGAAITLHSIADGQAEAIEFPVEESTLHQDIPLKNLKLKRNILVAAIGRGANIEIPNGESSFSKGDTVVIVSTSDEVILQLNDIFA